MKTIQASEFKAKCLAILDEVSRSGEKYTILKRGKPVAQLTPPIPVDQDLPQRSLRGTVRILGDIEGPVLDPADWEALGGGKG